MRCLAAVALICTLALPSLAVGADETALAGYSPRASQTERDWEGKLRAIPDPAKLREYMRRLSARPHHVGSPYDKDNAEWILAHFKEWGLDARIETFDVLFPTPRVRVVEMLEPVKFTAKLEEPMLAIDPTSSQKSEQLPTYNAYSIDGDVTAPLVFVNYGLPDKQEEIRERNQQLEEGVFKATFDPRRPTVAPPREDVPPHLNFAPMQNAAELLVRSAHHYQQTLLQKQASLGESGAAQALHTLNQQLIESERRLTNADGLPRRPWYKHLLYAPGVYSGYEPKVIPGVREGIEQKRYEEAEQEIGRVAKALQDESSLIEEAARQLERIGR